MSMIYEFSDVALAYEQKSVLRDLSFKIGAGEFVGILGPNGSGKTTLLKLMAGVLKPSAGTIQFEGRHLETYTRKALAQRVSVLPQETFVDFPFRAIEVVLMGRAPYLRTFQWESAEDLRLARDAMARTDCLELADQDIRSLSGGERERVFLARALAQQPRVLLLDEPTTHLDLKHQVEIFRLLQELHAEQGLTLITVLHDLNFAALSCQRVLLLGERRLHADGRPEEILQPSLIREVYGVEVERQGGVIYIPCLSDSKSPSESR